MSELSFVGVILIIYFITMSVIYNNVIIVTRSKVNTGKQYAKKRVVYLADMFSNNHSLRINSIIEKVRKCSPDIIVVTGRLPEECKIDPNGILSKLSEIATVYCAFSDVDGSIASDEIKILNEYSVLALSSDAENADVLSSFSKLDNLKILICEKPSDFDKAVCEKDIDMSLCWQGGGLMLRMPFYGLVYSTIEGLLPKYPGRYHKKQGTHLFATTGVGKSFLPLRISNFREIPCIDIE